MSNLDSTAELRKLGHSLGVPVERLSALADATPADLRALRRQLGEALFQADKHHFAKIATLSKAIPTPIAAKVTEFALPPLLAARTAELLEPHRAGELVNRISDSYLADVAAAMDAGRAPHVVEQIQPDRVAKVGAELARREEWVVIGGFVAHVSHKALRAAVTHFTGEQLLRIGFVLDDTSRLDDIADMLSDDQIDQMRAAAVEQGLWVELDEIISHVSDDRLARIAARFADDQVAADAALAAVARGAFSEAGLRRLSGA